MSTSRRRSALSGAVLALVAAVLLTPAPNINAADHADSPNASSDRAADLADTYIFLDPADNTKVVIGMTLVGFIVPGEAVALSGFDPGIRYRFELETSGDPKADKFLDVRFSTRTSGSSPQTATITLPNGRTFTAPTTVPTVSASPNPPTITTDATSGVDFFAGETDDPFYFDVVAFQRFRASAAAGSPDKTVFQRGRDSFAGYNVIAIVLRMPISVIGPSANVIGINSVTQRQKTRKIGAKGEIIGSGNKFLNIDRAGGPAVNALLIPFPRKNEFNAASGVEDAALLFVSDLSAILTSFGTDATNRGILASVLVLNGDYLRLDTTKPNSGPGGGNNATAAFPNGRRPGDDVVDITFFFINNQVPLGDAVPSNDVPLRDAFPYLGAPQQPREGNLDDNTAN